MKAQLSSGLLGAKAAAERLGLSVWTVYAWARAGRIPSVRLGARRLFAPEDLEQLIASSRTPDGSSPSAGGRGQSASDGLRA
jgi:excisionase family DNA binding protein